MAVAVRVALALAPVIALTVAPAGGPVLGLLSPDSVAPVISLTVGSVALLGIALVPVFLVPVLAVASIVLVVKVPLILIRGGIVSAVVLPVGHCIPVVLVVAVVLLAGKGVQIVEPVALVCVLLICLITQGWYLISKLRQIVLIGLLCGCLRIAGPISSCQLCCLSHSVLHGLLALRLVLLPQSLVHCVGIGIVGKRLAIENLVVQAVELVCVGRGKSPRLTVERILQALIRILYLLRGHVVLLPSLTLRLCLIRYLPRRPRLPCGLASASAHR